MHEIEFINVKNITKMKYWTLKNNSINWYKVNNWTDPETVKKKLKVKKQTEKKKRKRNLIWFLTWIISFRFIFLFNYESA